MKKSILLKAGARACLFVAVMLLPVVRSYGQSVFDVSVDLYSRYVWRGFDFGNSPSVQPAFSFTKSGFTAGVWGAFATTGHTSNPPYSETDVYLSWSVPVKTGSISLGVTDYFFPSSTPNDYFDYADNHTFEANIGVTPAKSFPLSISGNINFAGSDKDYSAYFELDYPVSTATITFGFIPWKSGYYGTNTFAVVNTGISDSKEIPLTGAFSLVLHGSVIVNPYTKNIFLLGGISL